ncbi:MAG: hypothetical protein KGJ10_02955 [Acidobacteriota bacterium]|nr:hypothetical protein [Acidobacteriota bacterium]MDE3043772.1 hypothetical protein [Acidobacteriota bacterium]
MAILFSNTSNFLQAILDFVTAFLGVATWRMAKATKSMLTKADDEIVLAQEQVRIAALQVDISQQNEIAARQPVIVAAVPEDAHGTRVHRRGTDGVSFAHSNPVGSSFYSLSESGNRIGIYITLRNVGPGIALIPLDSGLPTVTGSMKGGFHGNGLPQQSAVAPGDTFEVVFDLPIDMVVPSSTSGWSTGVTPALEFLIWYSDLTGITGAETRIIFSDNEKGLLTPVKTEFTPNR